MISSRELSLENYRLQAGVTKLQIAKALNISTPALKQKMTGSRDFKVKEAFKLMEMLDIPLSDFERVFSDGEEN